MIYLLVSSMANEWWIAFLATLLINQNALGYSTFDPGTTWYEGIGPRHALDLQEKVNSQDRLGSILWCKLHILFVFLHNTTINDTAFHLDIIKR